MAMDYATSSVTSKCYMRLDYSYYIGGECNECVFCYRRIDGFKKYKIHAGYLNREVKLREEIFDVPIIISKNCDPLVDEACIKHSYTVMKTILESNGYIIFRSALHNIPKHIFDILVEYKHRVMYQPHIFCEMNSFTAPFIKSFCPKYSLYNDILETMTKFIDNGVDVALYIDPIILGINNEHLIDTIKKAKDIGCKKVIIKQLFSTLYFLEYLSLINKKFVLKLTEETFGYYTYNSDLLLQELFPIIEYCHNEGIKLSLCGNLYISKMLIGNENCCLFNDPYKIHNPYVRVKNINMLKYQEKTGSAIIQLKDKK